MHELSCETGFILRPNAIYYFAGRRIPELQPELFCLFFFFACVVSGMGLGVYKKRSIRLEGARHVRGYILGAEQ